MAHEKTYVICENLCLEEGMTKEQINDLVSTEDTKLSTNLQSQINSLASGSPKGTYTDSAALKAANPATGVYIATGNGHIYSWTKNQSGDPMDLGVYQSTGIADGSVEYKHFSNDLQKALKDNKLTDYFNFNLGLFDGSTKQITPASQGTATAIYCDDFIAKADGHFNWDTEESPLKGRLIFIYKVVNNTYTAVFGAYSSTLRELQLEAGTKYRFVSTGTTTNTTNEVALNVTNHLFIEYGQIVGDTENVKKLINDVSNINDDIDDINAQIESLGGVTEVNVTVGTGKDYTTIAAAISSIADSSKTKIYNIVIDDGTYQEKDLTLPDYVNLVGASGNRANCKIQGYLSPSSSDAVINPCSTINISKNNQLRNLTITAQNMRYPIHDESNGSFKNWVQKVDNCHIEHLGNQEVKDYRTEHGGDPSTVWSSCYGWGEGSSSGAKLTISNSTIKSVSTAFYTHAANSISKPYYHELINCKLISKIPNGGFSVNIDDTTSPIDGNTLIIKDCYINGRIGIVGTNKHNMMISGSGVHPIYQKPERVLLDTDFPIFTDYIQEYVANETINKGTFVYTTDGKTIQKANSTTPKNLILGYAIGNNSQGSVVKVMKGYMQPTTQTWPESDSLTAGKYYKVGSNGALTETTNPEEAIAISSTRFYKLLI